ncbi:hypothetical protein FXO38_25337 [Capsicum annuum]|nr:hypothetical protein FXO38_25337 [Capsicum annuum]
MLITFRLMNPDLDLVNGAVKEKLDNFCNELRNYSSVVDFPRINENYTGRTTLNNIAKVIGIIKFDLHAEPETRKSQFEVGENIQEIFDLRPDRFGSEAVFILSHPGTECEEDDGYLIFFVHDENTEQLVFHSLIYIFMSITKTILH